MSASRLRNAPVQGITNQKMMKALAHAFTTELLHQQQLRKREDWKHIVLCSHNGQAQVVFQGGQWIVCGRGWGMNNVPRRILHLASQQFPSRISQETLFEMLTEAVHLSFHSNANPPTVPLNARTAQSHELRLAYAD